MKTKIRIFTGPSTLAPFAAVALEITNPVRELFSISRIEKNWLMLKRTPLKIRSSPNREICFIDLVVEIALHLQHPEDEGNGRILTKSADDPSMAWIFLAYLEPSASATILHLSFQLASALTRREQLSAEEADHLHQELTAVCNMLARVLPQAPIIRTLVREAQIRGIPVTPVAGGSRVWQFGQGSKSAHYVEAASDRDALTGAILSGNKSWTKEFLKRLGFPVAEGGIAPDTKTAIRLTHQLGYPVVIKPISSGKGKGVTANILTHEELVSAFSRASRVTPGGVIIERHIEGIDHRLAVFGGRLAWAVARYPAHIIGDGKSTIRELIHAENKIRSNANENDPSMSHPLKYDGEMEAVLSKQGLSLEDRPLANQRIALRSIANVSRGGSYEDISHRVHPDNQEMAEAISRAFHLESIGIDLMTPAIERSWREIPCAILEVNATPGIFHDKRAAKVLDARFTPPDQGRIPTVLIIGHSKSLMTLTEEFFAGKGFLVGVTDQQSTQLAGKARFGQNCPITARIQGLLSDPSCSALIVRVEENELRERGLPLDQFDLVLSEETAPSDLKPLLLSCCKELDDNINSLASTERIFRSLERIALSPSESS